MHLQTEVGNSSMCHTVCFTDLDHGYEIISKFSMPKLMKHTVFSVLVRKGYENTEFEFVTTVQKIN
jgi:hypothetical protein